jgi:hypothetical protein
MAYHSAPTEEQLAAFRVTLDRLAGEYDGLLFQRLENVHLDVLDAAVADLEAQKRLVYLHLSKEEVSAAGMIHLLHGLLQLGVFKTLQDVQVSLSKAFEQISQKSEVLIPLFDRYQLQSRPIDFMSMEFLLMLPVQFHERRPRQPPVQRKKRRIMIGYPSPDEETITGKVYMVLVLAEMLHKHYNTYAECRIAILGLLRAFEPQLSNFEPVLSLFWIELFLRNAETPKWLDWETITEIVNHYEFE